MRWRWIACAAVVLLAGCVYHPSAAQDAAYQKTFVKQLTRYCANVDDQLTGVNRNSQPGKWAQQLRRFASEARSRRLPQTKRQQLDILLTTFTDASRQYQSAQTALRSGNARAAQAAVNRANATMEKANLVAQRYGMPPLKNCPKVVDGQSQAQLAWQPGNDSRLAVQQAPAAVLGGRIWVAGGLTGPMQATAETQVYDPTVRTWGPGPALPVALNHAMMVNYRGTLWVIGGFVSQGGNPTATASARVLKLNKAQNGWIEGPPLHHARAAGAAAVVGDKIVVAGGRTGDPGKPVLPTEVYNGISWHDARAIPTPGDHLAAASDGTYLYVVGGEKLTSSFPLATVQRFNPATSQWTQLPPMPAAAANVGAAVAGGQLITLGGETLGSVFNTVRDLNLTTRAWSNLPNMPFARHGMGVAVIGNSLYAVNGAAQLGHKGSTKTMQILIMHS
jgi:Kelch motif